jgi:hypothetical protein
MKLTPRKISETEIKHQVKQYLDLKGWFNFHLIAGMGSYPGLVDRIAVKGGRTLYLEIKKPIGGKQSKNQRIFQERIEKAGGRYLLIKNLDDLIEALEGELKC